MKVQKSTKYILHLDLDTFFVSVERLKNPKLNQLPVIVGGSSPRSVVSACSYETRRFGVHSGMSIVQARRLCPQAVVLSSGLQEYAHFSHAVRDIVAQEAPLFEQASIDEFYVDLAGMERFFNSYKWSKMLKTRIIQETGLPISFGLSPSKTVSKMATNEAKPLGELFLKAEQMQAFLDPLPVNKIPGVGAKTHQKLQKMSIYTIKHLRKIPVEYLEATLGKYGKVLWQKATGTDNRGVKPHSVRKSISAERTFAEDTSDIDFLLAEVAALLEKVAYRLRKKSKLAATISIKIRYSNFETYTVSKRISYTNFDHKLIQEAHKLLRKTYKIRRPVRLIGVRLSDLLKIGYQLDLYEDITKMSRLYHAIDSVKNRFGTRAIFKAGSNEKLKNNTKI